MFIAKIRVTLRTSILDPQGKAVQHAMATMGARKVRDVRIGKYIEASIDAESEAEARQMTEDVCRKLLANPVMEDYTYDIVRGA
ncbi:MAG TPA: phosphoribosylformylglycinamidine synthase subunit PurS [Bacteroidota bacterium]|nr:phosphoribosylformylglycinamidine synthase subunit PurS [Bacteroidota bacterium]